MEEPEWIEPEAIRIAHARQLQEHGGLDGVRDPGMLDSALNRPKNVWAYSMPKPDNAALAAAYAFGIAKNHPFVDGNKRTAMVVCEAFMISRGYRVSATEDQWYDAVIALASGGMAEADFAAWLRDHATPTSN